MIMGSGINSYWFTSSYDVAGMCCNYLTVTNDVHKDDYGDYTIACEKCGGAIDVWKDDDSYDE